MTFKQRLPYFLGGLTIGIIFVVFIFGKKNTTFDYGPNARILKNLRIKERVFSKEVMSDMSFKNIDTADISAILKNGNVDIGNKIKLDSCLYQYNIKGKNKLNNIVLTVKNCDSTVYIEKIIIE
ncbi:MAG: DUF4258 domain-containing protein [Bacteroidetes bacterium]|nr:DUF4258 domain-containing protein [Bacteroidota bacterium]